MIDADIELRCLSLAGLLLVMPQDCVESQSASGRHVTRLVEKTGLTSQRGGAVPELT
jgi:hypothetical protein